MVEYEEEEDDDTGITMTDIHRYALIAFSILLSFAFFFKIIFF